MKKIVPAIVCIFACILFSSSIFAQVYTETFESVTGSGKPLSFTNNGQTFNIITNTPGVGDGGLLGVFIPGNQYTMPGGGPVTNGGNGFGVGASCVTDGCPGVSNKFIDNGSSVGTGQVYSIKTNDGKLFSAKSIYLFVSDDYASTAAASGTLTIRGKKAGAVVYTIVKNNAFNTSFSSNNGFNFINFSNAGNVDNSYFPIDELEFTMGSTFNYFAIDNFTYTQVHNWTGGTGTWNNAANWDRGTVPVAASEVNISAGTPNLNVNSTCVAVTNNGTGNLTISSNTLSTAVVQNSAQLIVNNSLNATTILRNFFGGTISGSSTITTPTVSNNGTISPGNSPGLLSITGRYTHGTTANWICELGGLTPGTGYDRLAVSLISTIQGGTLSIRLANGFTPAVGQTFTFATHSSSTGSFSNLSWPAGVNGTVSYNSTNLVITISSVLPLRLESFSGTTSGNKNTLAWKTSAEVNVKNYGLQWSRNGVDFESINNQASKAPATINNYNYVHANANRTNYYRLKMTDNDGKATFSNIVKLENGRAIYVNIYPNPVIDKLQIDLPSTGNASAQFINAAGQTVRQTKLSASNNSLNIGDLPKGVYTLRITQGENIITKQIVKQ